MLFNEITPKNVEFIERCIETILLRLNVKTRVKLSARTYRGEETIIVDSSDITTSPMMFKRIRVIGEGRINHDEEHPKCYDLNIGLDYRYDLFDGGSNGTRIGTAMLRIIQDGTYQSVRFKGLLLTAYVEDE